MPEKRAQIIKSKNSIAGTLFCISFFITSLSAQDPGYNAFMEKKYSEADNYYEKRLERSTSPGTKLLYNKGTSAYMLQDYEKAKSFLTQSLAAGSDIQKSNAHYNLGLLSMKEKNSSEALEHFRKSLLYDPNNIDSKVMLEKILRQQAQKQEQQKKEEKENNSENKNDQQQKKNDKKNREDKNGEKKENRDHKQNNDTIDDTADKKKAKTSQKSMMDESDLKSENISREQAENILNAMKDSEKESMKKLMLNKARKKRVKRSKDW